jgi:hypothetical protein
MASIGTPGAAPVAGSWDAAGSALELGDRLGTTDLPDTAGPAPAAFTARTVKVTVVPAASPDKE